MRRAYRHLGTFRHQSKHILVSLINIM